MRKLTGAPGAIVGAVAATMAFYHVYARLIRHARDFILQLAGSHLTRAIFRRTLGRIEGLAWYPT